MEERGERMKMIFILLFVAGLLLLGSVSLPAETQTGQREFSIPPMNVLDVTSGISPCGGGNGGGGAPG